ncbi:hypothetical protein BDZ89DRAFT_678758 [Hymenopellis radicata]|nr:hypothetical protein BDZ89DRAFT_678758 [Hymenopellis radicata]
MQPDVPNTSTNSANDGNSWAPRPSLSTLYQRASDTLPGFLDTSSPSRPQNVVNDPFDYEQKYAPDEQYAEMSPMARVFRVYNDESLKYDTEMVNGWREGLDMLLLFAALFSAVVTAFVTSTSPSMRVDNSEVTNSLISEMISVQRAMLHVMVFGPKDVQTVPSTVASFHPKASDLWVNGLWFASLGLSLATTLLAVLAKQWIHQYTSFTSGSPRDRARIRHFRYTALQRWHVPIFIELLPVLMHAALGLFFIGLVVYLCSLSTVMAVNMAFTGAAAFGMYSISTVLPVFYTDCPYKTPLSLYFFIIFSSIRHWALRWNSKSVTPSSSFCSLRDVELETVSLKGDVMDASALGWLFNVTSNLSVESIIIQALGGLPLQSIPLITKAGPEGIASVLKAINDHFHLDQPRDKFERFQRAALLFENQEPEVTVLPVCTEPSLYSHIRNPCSAIQFITSNALGPADDRLDPVLWAKLFSTAMRPGTTWLRIHHDEPSRLWAELLSFAVVPHDCDRCNCKRTKQPLLSFPLQEVRKEGARTGISERKCSVPLLSIDSTTNKTCSLEYALCVNMLPSYLAWLLHVGFPDVIRSPDNHTAALPDDMLLCLTMLQTPSVQKTSSLYRTWVADDPLLLELLDSGERPSPFRQILDVIKEYTINIGVGVDRHVDVDRATILAMQNVMSSELFGSSTAIVLEDEAIIVHSVFEGLNWRL